MKYYDRGYYKGIYPVECRDLLGIILGQSRDVPYYIWYNQQGPGSGNDLFIATQDQYPKVRLYE